MRPKSLTLLALCAALSNCTRTVDNAADGSQLRWDSRGNDRGLSFGDGRGGADLPRSDGAFTEGPPQDATAGDTQRRDSARQWDSNPPAPDRGGSPHDTTASNPRCDALKAFDGTAHDAAPTLQACIDSTPAGATLELPAGRYQIAQQLQISARPIVLTTASRRGSGPCTNAASHGCAELVASTAFNASGGLLRVTAGGSTIDHLVLNGNKSARNTGPAARNCLAGKNSFGYNMQLACNNCGFEGSVSRDALCGTGLEVSGITHNITVRGSTFAGNGAHNLEMLWADGMTVHDSMNSTFVDNTFIDNTDVDLIFGGCAGCTIQRQAIRHSAAFAGGSFAAMMIHAWPTTSGDYTGADISQNSIDCGSEKRCGFGLYVGSDAWYKTETHGGAVFNNTVTNAQLGMLIDDASDMRICNNSVSQNGSSTVASCGTRPTTPYAMGSRSARIDSSCDPSPVRYTRVDWDGCVANWWKQGSSSACDPQSQPAPHWGLRDGVCRPSCGALGGTTGSNTTPCTTSGLQDAGIAYDALYCCKAPTSCDPQSQPPPHWGMRDGVCRPSCGALGGTFGSNTTPCATSGLQDVGIAYDALYCCK